MCNDSFKNKRFTIFNTALCTDVEVKYADEKMDISCSCGFPSVQAELEYKVFDISVRGPL